jgi:hypothetical protein
VAAGGTGSRRRSTGFDLGNHYLADALAVFDRRELVHLSQVFGGQAAKHQAMPPSEELAEKVMINSQPPTPKIQVVPICWDFWHFGNWKLALGS